MENRKILSPFLRLSDLTIHNIDTSEEHMVLVFKDENYYIDARWDRLVLGYEGTLDTIEDYQNIFKHYLEILNKYTKLETFGKITNVLLIRFLIKEMEGDDESIKQEFKKKYLTSNLPYLEGEEQDFAIVLENKKQRELTKITFGLYKPTKDIPRLKLFSITPLLANKFANKKGLLFEFILGNDSSQVDFNTVKKLYNHQRRIIESF